MTKWNTLGRALTTGAAGLLAALLATAPAAAQEEYDEGIDGEEGMLEDQGLFEDEGYEDTGTTYDDSDYYGLYDAGYDRTNFGNDWFYDYYEWSDPYSTEVGGYDYDYDADVFDWEEDGLFE